MTEFVWVPGIPKTQGSKMPMKLPNGRIAMLEGSSKRDKAMRAWRDAVRAAFVKRDPPLLEHAVRVAITFHLPRPKTVPKSARRYPHKKNDIDKLSRAVLDALTGVAYVDDGQVVFLTAKKLYAESDAEPGVRVLVEPL